MDDESGPLDIWGKVLCIWLFEGSWALDGIPLVKIDGGCRYRNANSPTDKKWGESHGDLVEAMCQMMNGSDE